MFKIPNDTGHPWRLNKFLSYHSLGDADMNFPILIEHVNNRNTKINERFWLAFLYSTCYCVPTTCFLFEELDIKEVNLEQLQNFWELHKPNMIFQSDKKYVKHMNWFIPMVMDFIKKTNRNPAEFFKQFKKDNQQEVYDSLYKEIIKWRYFGRFTTFLLIEAITKLTPLKADSNWFDWKNGNTATSGMLHLLYLDEKAVNFDKTGKLDKSVEAHLSKCFIKLKTAIVNKYPKASVNITDIETSLCGFRKLFKRSRYGGYYIDRVQEEIVETEHKLPKYDYLWKNLWEYRKKAFPEAFLGELNGYIGIQKKRKSEWVKEGLTGVEFVS